MDSVIQKRKKVMFFLPKHCFYWRYFERCRKKLKKKIVTMSAERLVEIRGGTTTTMDMVRD